MVGVDGIVGVAVVAGVPGAAGGAEAVAGVVGVAGAGGVDVDSAGIVDDCGAFAAGVAAGTGARGSLSTRCNN